MRYLHYTHTLLSSALQTRQDTPNIWTSFRQPSVLWSNHKFWRIIALATIKPPGLHQRLLQKPVPINVLVKLLRGVLSSWMRTIGSDKVVLAASATQRKNPISSKRHCNQSYHILGVIWESCIDQDKKPACTYSFLFFRSPGAYPCKYIQFQHDYWGTYP